MKFYDRKKEMKLLKTIENGRVAIIGRRRIGKTRLVEETYRNNLLTFFVSANKVPTQLINDWCDEYTDIELPRVRTLNEFFTLIFSHYSDRIIFIDELQNFVKTDRSFISDLQRLIDKFKPNLVVTGSIISLMKNIVEDYKSPLFGRFDIIINLEELDFKTICQVAGDLKYNIKDTIILYSIFGGIPKYYELIEKMKVDDIYAFTKDMFIFYPYPLRNEINIMLKEEFGSEYKVFFSILSSISNGKNSLKEISDYTGIIPTNLTKYISYLKDDFRIIKRITPVVGSGKKGKYDIAPNIFYFWFRMFWKYQHIVDENEDKASELFDKNINYYIGSVFENICISLIESKILTDSSFTKIGRQWGKIKDALPGENIYEIDVVGLNEKTKNILFGECKWKENVDAEDVFARLKEKAGHLVWNNECRKEEYMIIAKSFKDKKIKGVKLVDLEDIRMIV